MFPVAARKLRKDLGQGLPLSTLLSNVAFTICIFFYLYVFGSFLKVTVYPLINRVTFYSIFQEHVINQYFDYLVVIITTTSWFLVSIKNKSLRYSFSIAYGGTGLIFAIFAPNHLLLAGIALLSLPLIVSVILYNNNFYKSHTNTLNFNPKLALRYISLIIITISIIEIFFQISSSFVSIDTDTSSMDGTTPANELFLLLSSFSPIYVVFLIFCLAVKILFRGIMRVFKLDVNEDISQKPSSDDEPVRVRTQTKVGILLFAAILSMVLVFIPQHPSINIDNQDIGVDTYYYVNWIGELERSTSLSDFAHRSFIEQGQDGDRPLSLIIMFLVYQIVGGDLSEVIEYFPLILGPGIVLALYFLTLELTRNEKVSLLAAVLGAVSFHTLIGIYAGFYANWLALIVGYVSIVFLLRYLRSGHATNLVIFSTLLVGSLFLHVYTWTILAAVAGIFLVTMLVLQYKSKKNDISYTKNNRFIDKRIVFLLLFGILPSIAVDVSKILLTGSSGGLGQDIELAQTSLGVEQFSIRWEILKTTVHDSLGGVFSNFIILGLGLLWVIKSNLREHSTIFLMIFLSIGLIPLFIGNWIIQARVLYNMPFEIPASIALYYIYRRSGSLLVPLAACTWLVAVSLFTVMNYYLVPVPGMS